MISVKAMGMERLVWNTKPNQLMMMTLDSGTESMVMLLQIVTVVFILYTDDTGDDCN